MDTSLLRCFLTVSDTQSFSVAAARLNVTQSTVSHQIARLEEHLGKQLFERTTRNCRITADGRDLIPYAARVLQTVDEMEQNFKPRLISGTVMIGVPDDYCLFDPITEALRGFMTDKPGVAVEMKAGLAANHVRDLRDRNLDLAVVREVGEGSGEILRSERIVWIAGHKWAPPPTACFSLPRWMVAARIGRLPWRLWMSGACPGRASFRALAFKVFFRWFGQGSRFPSLQLEMRTRV